MLLFLARRKICSAFVPILASNLRCYASKSTQNRQSQRINSTMVDYLVASFGFSPDKAARVSRPIAHLNSPNKPEAVRRFLKLEGFSDDQLKTIITLHPSLLASSPEHTIKPNLQSLRDIGLSTSTLTQLILSGPAVLNTSSAASGINFWRDFFGGDETALVRAFKGNTNLGARDISRSISPKMSLFQRHGLSTQDIQRVVLKAPRLMSYRVSSVEHALMRTKEFGFQPESGMFVPFLHAMMSVSREVLQKKMGLLKTFRWSEDEFLSALCKAPDIVTLNEDNLRAKMDFLIGEANCDPSYIASCPVLLTYSLKKRLRPRLHVLHLLESKGLSGKRLNFFSYIGMTNGEFVKRFILPHKMVITGLHEAYLVALA